MGVRLIFRTLSLLEFYAGIQRFGEIHLSLLSLFRPTPCPWCGLTHPLWALESSPGPLTLSYQPPLGHTSCPSVSSCGGGNPRPQVPALGLRGCLWFWGRCPFGPTASLPCGEGCGRRQARCRPRKAQCPGWGSRCLGSRQVCVNVTSGEVQSEFPRVRPQFFRIRWPFPACPHSRRLHHNDRVKLSVSTRSLLVSSLLDLFIPR